MAEITNELIYEIPARIQSDISELKRGRRETNARLNAPTTDLVGLRQDISNISATLTRHQARLDRIERRLEIAEQV